MRIGVITSGGDAPGMNAAIRAVVRTALFRGAQVVGFCRGYEGILRNEAQELTSRSVGGIIDRGGTILRSARCKGFMERDGREKAMAVLRENGVEGLVVIGGDGSLRGANKLREEFGFPVMVVPGSIDNDIPKTDSSIGFDTAINTAVEAIDRVRDTAYSHERVFVIEVMGRRNGLIALEAGIAGGAEAIILPEAPFSIDSICDRMRDAAARGKLSSIIVVAEGAAHAQDVKEMLKERIDVEARAVVLGHMQRGGRPTAFDRVLAMRLGSLATNRILSGYSGEMAGLEGNCLVTPTLDEVIAGTREIDPEKLMLAEVMAH